MDLTRDLVGIGVLFAETSSREPDIEETLVAASIEGMELDDLRVLALVVTWLSIHAPRINADRLLRMVKTPTSVRVRAFWSAIGHWLGKDPRLARLKVLYRKQRLD